jgi:hypothetical protein
MKFLIHDWRYILASEIVGECLHSFLSTLTEQTKNYSTWLTSRSNEILNVKRKAHHHGLASLIFNGFIVCLSDGFKRILLVGIFSATEKVPTDDQPDACDVL